LTANELIRRQGWIGINASFLDNARHARRDGNFFAGIAGASAFGWIAGEHAAEQSRKNRLNEDPAESDTVRKCKHFSEEMMDRDEGASWQEGNQALQQITRAGT